MTIAMTTAIRTIGAAAALTLALGAATPLHAAITAQLAKTCRAMMIKAHPLEVFGPTGSAAAQRDYFAQCVRRNADMSKANDNDSAAMPAPPPPTTDGQGH